MWRHPFRDGIMGEEEGFLTRKSLLKKYDQGIQKVSCRVCFKRLLNMLLSVTLAGCVSSPKTDEKAAAPRLPEELSAPFRVGERLTYDVYYGLIFAGTATLVIENIVAVCGRMTYHVMLTAKTSPAFSNVFRVNDRIESYIDVERFIPWKFAKVQEEGDYRHDEVSILDQGNHLGHYRSNRTGYTKEYEIPEGCQDTLSVFYFMRLVPYEVGETVTLKVMADERIWDARFETKEVTKRTIYRGGTYETFLVESDASFDMGALQKGEGRLWVSTDERRLPVCIKTRLTFGNLTLALVKADNIYENPQGNESKLGSEMSEGSEKGVRGSAEKSAGVAAEG